MSTPGRGWSPPAGQATTLVLVRHGATDATLRKLFSGGRGGADLALNDTGRRQAGDVAEWLAANVTTEVQLLVSPTRRTVETARIIADRIPADPIVDEGLLEMSFGDWEGSSFNEVARRAPDALARWTRDQSVAPPNGESMSQVQARVLAWRDRAHGEWPGETLVCVTHVTPIKVLVADALGAPLDAAFRMELAPASVSIVAWYAESGSLRLFNAVA